MTLASGIALVERLNLGYGSFWIDFSLIAWALSFLTGMTFLGPQSERVGALLDERGFEDPRTEGAVRRLLLVARFDSTLLLLVVIDMVVKPAF